MNTMRWIVMTIALSGAALACGEHDDPFDGALEFSGPFTTASSLVWSDPSAHQLVFATPGENELEIGRTSLGDERTKVRWIRPTVAGDRLLVLVEPKSAKEEDVTDRLFIYPAGGGEPEATFELEAAYSTVTLSPDGHWAVLHFDAQIHDGLLQNANQVGLLDLESGTLESFSLNGFGGSLEDVQFPAQNTSIEDPTVVVGSREREIITFLAEGEVVLVDAIDPALPQVAVRFPAELNFYTSETLLRHGNERYANPAVFLRSDSSSDVAMLTLVEQASGNDFTAQVSLVPVGTSASDFTLHDGEDVPYLVTLDHVAQRIVFTDIRTQQGFSVALEGQAYSMFVRTNMGGGRPQPQLVAWGPNGTAIHTLDLGGIDDALGQRPEQLDIRQGIGQLVRLDNDRVIVSSNQSATTLYVVDFPTQQVSPLTAQSSLDPASSALDGDLLVLGTPNQDWISAVDLRSLNPESVLLDSPIRSFHYLQEAQKVVVVHPDASGYVTVVGATDLSRSNAYSTWGVLLTDVLERKEQDP